MGDGKGGTGKVGWGKWNQSPIYLYMGQVGWGGGVGRWCGEVVWGGGVGRWTSGVGRLDVLGGIEQVGSSRWDRKVADFDHRLEFKRARSSLHNMPRHHMDLVQPVAISNGRVG